MNQPTAKQKQEAREIIEGVFGKRGSSPIYATAGRLFDELEARFDDALSSRDTEIREVLEGLVMRTASGRCWCRSELNLNITGNHEPRCLAARGLWEKVNVTESGK